METRKTLFVAALTIMSLIAADATHAATVPVVNGATLTYHIDAHDINNDGGTTAPADGASIVGTSWTELTTGAALNVQSTPTYQASSINGGPAVRFDGGPAGGDLVFSNNAAIFNTSAQTIFAVAKMASDAHVLSNLVSNSSGTATIRQTTAETANYFPGNSADFHTGGSFSINGYNTFAIDGGFDTAHVVRSVSPTLKNINSLRIGDNANHRIWAGDVAEILVYDGVLDANDTARVHLYLGEKYALPQVVDAATSNTAQVADKPFDDYSQHHIGVNFHYGTPGAVATTFKGIGFDNVDVTGLPTGPIALNANSATAGATVEFDWTITSDNTQRGQSAGFTGTDSTTLNAVANEMFYLSAGGDHPTMTMTFAGLAAEEDTFVQILGGDSGWTGDIAVNANGLDLDWTTVANGSFATGSLFAFWAETDVNGELEITLTGVGHFSGVGGLIVTQEAPAPAALPAGLLMLTAFAARRRRRNA